MDSSAILSQMQSKQLLDFIPYWNSNLLVQGKHIDIAAIKAVDKVEVLNALKIIVFDQASMILFPSDGDVPLALVDMTLQQLSDAVFFNLKEGQTSVIVDDQKVFLDKFQSVNAENVDTLLDELKFSIFTTVLENIAAGVIKGFMWVPPNECYVSGLILLDNRRLFSSSMSKTSVLRNKLKQQAQSMAREEELREMALKNAKLQLTVRKDLLESDSGVSDRAEGLPTSEEEERSGDDLTTLLSTKGKGKRLEPTKSYKIPKKAKTSGSKIEKSAPIDSDDDGLDEVG